MSIFGNDKFFLRKSYFQFCFVFFSDFSSTLMSEADARMRVFSVAYEDSVTLTCFSEFNHTWESTAPFFENKNLYKKHIVCELISACKSTFQNSGYFQNHYFFRFEIYQIFFCFELEFFQVLNLSFSSIEPEFFVRLCA